MKLADLKIKGTGVRPGVRTLRKLLGKGRTEDARGRTEMTFPLENYDRVYKHFEDEFGEPKKQQHGVVKFGQYRLVKQQRAGKPAAILMFGYM